MASKRKKKSALTKKEKARLRSLAAKKGWATRRKKVELKKSAKNQNELIKNATKGTKKKKAPTVKVGAAKTVEELEAIIELQKQQIEVLEMTKNWPNAMPPELLHRDGTIALKPSRLRHLGQETNVLLKILKKAMKKGEQEFTLAANLIATQYEVAVREVYTLWYSP